jgi:hypothetical protein
MILNQFDERLFFAHIYINVQICIENFKLKEYARG